MGDNRELLEFKSRHNGGNIIKGCSGVVSLWRSLKRNLKNAPQAVLGK